MIGFEVRRFMAQQLVSVTQHIPILHGVVCKLQSSGQWLITPEEAEFARKVSEEDGAVESRCVFSVRRARSTVTGVGSACWNVGVGCICAPLVGLTVLSAEMREKGLGKGLPFGLAYGVGWSASFLLIGCVAAVQQLTFGCANDVLRVYHYSVGLQQWDDVLRSYVKPSLAAVHPIIHSAPSSDALREAALRRALRNKAKSIKSDDAESKQASSSDEKKKTAGNDPEGGDDLYATLGLSKGATDKEIKEAYNRLALTLHPDRNSRKDAHEQFDRVTKAYKILNNPAKRKKYDLGGHAGLQDQGAQKRDVIRSILGGDELNRLVGEVRTSPIFLRVVDGLDYLPHDAAIVARRGLEACCAELLVYLDGFPAGEEVKEEAIAAWIAAVKRRMVKYCNTALAKEVLFVVGHEYQRSVHYVRGNPASRMMGLVTSVAPHRLGRRVSAISELVKVNVKVTKDMTAFMNLSWKFIAIDLERNAREVALAVMLDNGVTSEERQRRLRAMDRLSSLFIANGTPFAGANKATMEKLVESMRDYQRARASAKAKQE